MVLRRSPRWVAGIWGTPARVAVALWVSMVLWPGLRGAPGQPAPGRLPATPEECAVQAPAHCWSAEEMALAKGIDDHRAAHGLPAVPRSRSLTEVAKAHVFDLEKNGANWATDEQGVACSLHSWSGAGPWSSVCYTRDHRYAGEMWNKPKQVTGDRYPWPGIEIAHWCSVPVTPAGAVAAWKASPSHNAVLLEQPPWKNSRWAAMGVALGRHYAVVWFGSKPDPQGGVDRCEESRAAFLKGLREGLLPPGAEGDRRGDPGPGEAPPPVGGTGTSCQDPPPR